MRGNGHVPKLSDLDDALLKENKSLSNLLPLEL